MQFLPHPRQPSGAAHDFQVMGERSPPATRIQDLLSLKFRLAAELAQWQVPPVREVTRADGLWHHTCFEVFIRARGGETYWEFNFSPSGAWAAYAFTGYRAGRENLWLPVPPAARWHQSPTLLELRLELPLGVLTPAAHSYDLGVAAVLEGHSGTISHWALHHPAGPPDFHHPESFVWPFP